MCQSCVLNSEAVAAANLHSAIDSAVLLSSGSSDPQACGSKRQVPTDHFRVLHVDIVNMHIGTVVGRQGYGHGGHNYECYLQL
jgi:microcompartment protein CcmK/EutM